ncbi:MAG: aminopeptidase P family protein [Deltaproteobacteria bacterium]|nr:aminopeptidase P family protein [Deltaproteobacteria bacterium]
MISLAESRQRTTAIQKLLNEKGLDGALFIFPIDVYYYTGTRQNSALWIPVEGEPMLLVRKSYSRAKEESPLADIRPFPSSKEFPALFGEHLKKIGFTFDVAPVQQLNFYSKMLPGREFIDISGLHRELKSVKSSFELEQLRLTGAASCSVFAAIPEFLKRGMREIDIAAELECRLRKAGSEGYVRMRAYNQELFMGLAVSAGAASFGFFDGAVTGRGLSCASPHGASSELLRENEPIILDYSFVRNGYITDMTRVFVFGTLDPELQRAFDLSLEIQGAIQKALKPGAICEELFFMAAGMAEAAGFGKNFMGMPGEQARFVGHGVGLELDELPVLAQGFKAPLQAGQTIAIEPKFVIPGKGAIGIENTFAVTAEGGEKITDMPDEIIFL